jgi:hypothetical protein
MMRCDDGIFGNNKVYVSRVTAIIGDDGERNIDNDHKIGRNTCLLELSYFKKAIYYLPTFVVISINSKTHACRQDRVQSTSPG